MEAILFLSDSAKKEFDRLVTAGVQAWSKSWCFSAPAPEVKELGKNVAADKAAEHFQIEGLEYSLTVGVKAADWKNIVFAEHAQKVPKGIEEEALLSAAKEAFVKSIYAKLLQRDSTRINVKALTADELVSKESKLGDSNIALEVSIAGVQIKLILPVESEFSFMRPKQSKKVKLGKVEVSDLSETVEAQVTLDLGDFDISVLKNLSVGDVLSSSVSLQQEFSLSVKDKKISNAFLGKKDGQKAILVQK